jgi:hypothetical protein
MDERIKELAGTINEFLINLAGRIDDIYNSEQTGNSSDEDRILNLLDDLGALTEGISEIDRFFDNIDITELQEKLSFMSETLERKDSLLFADTLQYELKPLLVYWSGILSNE